MAYLVFTVVPTQTKTLLNPHTLNEYWRNNLLSLTLDKNASRSYVHFSSSFIFHISRLEFMLTKK